jgi:hypothetical protein
MGDRAAGGAGGPLAHLLAETLMDCELGLSAVEWSRLVC